MYSSGKYRGVSCASDASSLTATDVSTITETQTRALSEYMRSRTASVETRTAPRTGEEAASRLIRALSARRLPVLSLSRDDEGRDCSRPSGLLRTESSGSAGGAADDLRRRAGLLERVAALGRADAVARAGALDNEVVLQTGVVARLELREVHRRGVVAVVRVVRLDGRHRRADVRLSSRALSAILEAEVRRDRDRQQDAEDHDDDQELDEREALVARQPLLEL